jgi:HNH endonuclease
MTPPVQPTRPRSFSGVYINMSQCIFCASNTVVVSHEEHILPESLGGDKVLTKPLVCNQCNAYFGAKVEQPALSSPLLASLRAFFCLPNKNGRYARYRVDDLILSGTPFGIPFLQMHPERAEAVLSSQAGLVIPFDFTHKGSIVRMLLKTALESIADSNAFNVFDKRFDPA